MVSCGTDDPKKNTEKAGDPKKNAEKAGECRCAMVDLSEEYLDLQYDLLKTYKKKKRKVKNPDYDPDDDEKRHETESTWEKEIDDWEEHVSIQIEFWEINEEYRNLQFDMYEYRMRAYETSDNQDDYDEWIEEFEEELEDYIEDNCEDSEEDVEKDWEKYMDEENDYFEDTPEEY